jgi:hypothetical protein
MGKPTGFMEYPKKSVPYRDASERTADFREIFTQPADEHLRNQGRSLHGLRRAVLPIARRLPDR